MTVERIARISRGDLDTFYGKQQFKSLREGKLSAVIIFGATIHSITTDNKRRLIVPCFNEAGFFLQEGATTIGGSLHLPDTPPRIDPHPRDQLDVLAMTRGNASAQFVNDFPPEMLDDNNEISEADLFASGLASDQARLERGDVVCFYGARTLHQIASLSTVTESLVNRYSLVAPTL